VWRVRGLDGGKSPHADFGQGQLRHLGPPAYRRLCVAAESAGATVRIDRDTRRWILAVTIQGEELRAGALMFPGADELDRHADHLYAWLIAVTDGPDLRNTLL
jgi:hypothetical protein